MKKGDKYWFVDTHFSYGDIPVPIIKKRTIYRIVGDDFSTKEEGDTYEVIQYLKYNTKKEAVEKAIKEVDRYRDNFLEKIEDTKRRLNKMI